MQLEVKNLTVRYGKVVALNGVSLGVEEGEIVALIGANGAGKTTLLRSISGLKRASEGEIVFEGQRTDGLPAHEVVRRGIAHVPEGRLVFAPLTVIENLRMGAYCRKDRRGIEEDIERMFNHFPKLRERRAQRAGSLSGGEQQMLSFARALMARPRMILMDEPSMGLSPALVDEVASIIAGIGAAGVSVLLVEQNAAMALAVSQRAYVLEVGSIVLEGQAAGVAQDERVRKAYLGA